MRVWVAAIICACAHTPPQRFESPPAAATAEGDLWQLLFYGAPTSPPVTCSSCTAIHADAGAHASTVRVDNDLLDAMAWTGEPPPVGPPFDGAATTRALRNVKATLKTCRRDGGGAVGRGRAVFTFDTSGAVTAAHLDDDALTASDVGQCVLAKFRATHIPPIGSPVTVTTTFSVE